MDEGQTLRGMAGKTLSPILWPNLPVTLEPVTLQVPPIIEFASLNSSGEFVIEQWDQFQTWAFGSNPNLGMRFRWVDR